MLWILLLCLVALAKGQWPPRTCKSPVQIHKNVMILTNERINNVHTSCDIGYGFPKNIYIQFRKVYTQKPQGSSDSIIGFTFISAEKEQFVLELHNDRILLKSPLELKSSSHECMSVLARREQDTPQWMRMRINHLFEIGKTFVSVDVTSFDGTVFIQCLRFEMPIVTEHLNMRADAYTMSGMRQEIHLITDKPPLLNSPKDNDRENRLDTMSKRLDRTEQSINRLQNALHTYMGYHDDHVQTVATVQGELRKQITGTKNNFESRTTSHFFVWVFVFMLSAIGVCFFVNWKFKQNRRWGHLM